MNAYLESLFLEEYIQLKEEKQLLYVDSTTYQAFLKTLYAFLATDISINRKTIISLATLFFAKNEEEVIQVQLVFEQAIQERLKVLDEQIALVKVNDPVLKEVLPDNSSAAPSQPQSKEKNKSVPNLATPSKEEANKPPPSSEIPSEKEQKKKKRNYSEEWFDVNLHLQEGETINKEGLSLQLDGNYFMLHDESIMPFSTRYLSQRSRKSFQTNRYIMDEEIDIPAMVAAYAKSELFEEIIYRKRPVNQSNIVLLSDRFGSMLSYEFLEDQLIRSFEMIPECIFEHYFFYNLPEKREITSRTTKGKLADYYYILRNANRGGKALETNKATWTADTIFLIFSDAGGHSGLVNKDRIRATIHLWNHLVRFSKKIFWLNPVPIEEMNDCTAKRLNLVINMYEPDYQGFETLFKKADAYV